MNSSKTTTIRLTKFCFVINEVQTEQSQPIKISETGTELKDNKVENQTKELEREENITCTTENIKRNNRKKN